MSIIDVVRRPTIGTEIEYTYGHNSGIMIVINTDSVGITFKDYFNGKNYQPAINYTWRTWDVHINSVINVTGIVSTEPDWEI